MMIDNLKVTPTRKRKSEMKKFEFFECDFCGSICEMPITQYKSYTDEQILLATYRCERCVKKLEPKRRGRPPKEKIENHVQQEEVNFDYSTQIKEYDIYYNDKELAPTQTLKIDNINHPAHYTSSKIECIDAIMSAVEGQTPQEAVCQANIIKYVWRFKRKNGKEDLQKAQWYLNLLIDLQED